jgi:cytochrome P450
LGNLPQLPKQHSWFQFTAWAKEYGPIYRIHIASQPHLILSTTHTANALLRARSTLYSDRPQLPMVATLLGGNLRPLFLPYGAAWRDFRRFVHGVAMPSVTVRYEGVQQEEALRMVRDLCREPAKYRAWLERFSGGVVMRLAYGVRLETGEEEVLRRIVQVNHNLERIGSPGAYLVDTFPWMMWLPAWLPGCGWKREGRRLHREEYGLFKGLVEDVMRRAERGDESVEGCWAKLWLDTKEKYEDMTEDHAYYVLGTVFEAAQGTTSAAMGSFLLAMVLHPAKFARMKEELDWVVGDERLPTLEDMPRLPYVRACVKETMRWRPVTAGGLPHQIIVKEDEYMGYRIPKGSVVHPVQRAIHREEALYPRPEEFLPERWLEKAWPTYQEPLDVYPNLTNFSSFGFGRRICPGHHIAEKNLNIQVAMIAWVCEVSEKKGHKPPEYEYTAGFNAQPKWFDFELRARRDRDKLVEERYQAVWGAKDSIGPGAAR